jgi:hypothetical protein
MQACRRAPVFKAFQSASPSRFGKALDLVFGKHRNAVFGKGRNFSMVNTSRQIWCSETEVAAGRSMFKPAGPAGLPSPCTDAPAIT